MTTIRLILLRLFLLVFGWIPLTGRILHAALVCLLVKRRRRPYGASSRFFTPEDLS